MECNPEGLSVLGRAEPNPEGYLFALSDYDYEQEQGSREQGAGGFS